MCDLTPDDLELWTDAIPTFRHVVPINMTRRTKEVREMRAWLKARFGPSRLITDDNSVVWTSRRTAWRHFYGGVAFRDSDHAFEFQMRWGGGR